MVTLWLVSMVVAHSKLVSPPDWLVTDDLGDPQKMGECGGTGTSSNVVTTVVAGSTLHVKWLETVLHPGHFRLAIATDRSQLVDPDVQTSNGQCMSATVQSPVVAPVVADGLFEHTEAAPNNTYETDIVVPSTLCEHCTLQLVQFMGSHGAPCLYYHCADIRIVAAADAGVIAPPTTAPSGCSSAGGWLPVALLIAMRLFTRRRNRHAL